MQGSNCHFQGARLGTEQTNWPATPETRRSRISRGAMARDAIDGARGLSSARLRTSPRRGSRRSARSSTAARRSISRGLAPPGTHNSGVALVEVTQADGPRLIVNNEEERFSGNKHTTEYPRASIDAMVATLRGMGRDIGDIDAWLTTWDYPDLAGTIARSVLEEAPQSLKLLRTHGSRRFRRPPARSDDPHAENPRPAARPFRARAADLHAAPRQPCLVFLCRLARSPTTTNPSPSRCSTAPAIMGSISLYVVENGEMRQLYCNDSMFDSLGAFYSVISSTQGGWTWLSSEGRYMGAAAWGDMNRASNPYYARLKKVLRFRRATARSGSTARWPTGTATPSIIPTRRR